jgi:dihydrofolate reductase
MTNNTLHIPEFAIIAAVGKNYVIGDKGDLAWRNSEDLLHFRKSTISHPVIMGRTTYECLPYHKKPLPGRLNVVLTKRQYYQPKGKGNTVTVVHSLNEAIDAVKNNVQKRDEIDYNLAWIIGGGEIYRQAIDFKDRDGNYLVNRMEITHVHKNLIGDTYFPMIDKNLWKEDILKRKDRNGFSFVTYSRK